MSTWLHYLLIKHMVAHIDIWFWALCITVIFNKHLFHTFECNLLFGFEHLITPFFFLNKALINTLFRALCCTVFFIEQWINSFVYTIYIWLIWFWAPGSTGFFFMVAHYLKIEFGACTWSHLVSKKWLHKLLHWFLALFSTYYLHFHQTGTLLYSFDHLVAPFSLSIEFTLLFIFNVFCFECLVARRHRFSSST